MAPSRLAELADSAADAAAPGLIPSTLPKQGGVDPLGLRQINFDLMDQVFPGLNNVAEHVRPFVVIAWAWRRAAVLAGDSRHKAELLRDFVDRVEVLFAWSQFLIFDEVPLPGRDVLAGLLDRPSYRFDGPEWTSRREKRRYSTALSAPINYGPALKSLGWVRAESGGVMAVNSALKPALDALEEKLGDLLEAPALSKLGPVVVSREWVRRLGKAWAWNRVSKAERDAMAEALVGETAPLTRRLGMQWVVAVGSELNHRDIDAVREGMIDGRAAHTPEQTDTAARWRRVQVRQLFRLTLEALFHWTLRELEAGPRTTEALLDAFLAAQPACIPKAAGDWLKRSRPAFEPTRALARLQSVLWEGLASELPVEIVTCLALCFAEAPVTPGPFESTDRLPLARAAKEAGARAGLTPRVFLRHVFESWIFGQHVYWCVGRGLADARGGGKTLLRLRVVLEEGGWSLAPRARAGSPPAATPDRLATALSLLRECRLLR